MGIYAILGETKQFICKRAHAPSGAVLMNEERPTPLHECSTEGCAEGFGIWVVNETKVWEADMTASDTKMTRAIEELWDAIGISKAPLNTQSFYADKKALRAKKPE